MSKQALSSDLQNHPALRDSRIAVFVVEALAVVKVVFNQWRDRRQTHKALAELDEYQLHDIGLTRCYIFRGPIAWWRPRRITYRALTELADADGRQLSDSGQRLMQEALQHLECSDLAKTGDRK